MGELGLDKRFESVRLFGYEKQAQFATLLIVLPVIGNSEACVN